MQRTETAHPASWTATSKRAPAARTAGAPEREPKAKGMLLVAKAAVTVRVAVVEVVVERRRRGVDDDNNDDDDDDGDDGDADLLLRLSREGLSFEARAAQARTEAARGGTALVDATGLASEQAGGSRREILVIHSPLFKKK